MSVVPVIADVAIQPPPKRNAITSRERISLLRLFNVLCSVRYAAELISFPYVTENSQFRKTHLCVDSGLYLAFSRESETRRVV